MKEVEAAFARIQGLLAKAAQGEEEEDELAQDLDQDLEAYARLKAQAKKEAKEDEDLEMDFEDEGEEEDQEAPVVKGEETSAVLTLIVRALEGIHHHLEALKEATLELAKQNTAIAKALAEVEGAVLDAPRMPKSGRRPARAPSLEVSPAEAIAKAVQAKDLFSAYDVAALESMLNRGDLEAIRRRFSPHQLRALGLEV